MLVTFNGLKTEKNDGSPAGDHSEVPRMSNKVRSSDIIQEVIDELQLTLRDAEKADAGNVSAGIRVRKRMQQAIAKLKNARKVISDIRHVLKAEKEEK